MDTIGKLKYAYHVGPYNYLGLMVSKLNPSSFMYHGDSYPYVFSPYCVAWQTERIIEVPIAQKILAAYKGLNILEVGNVMRHYQKVDHVVVDRDEKAPGVVNIDIRDYHPQTKYDLIICISTLEHVGERGALIEAYENMYSLLRKGGMLFVTIPTDYNPDLDEFVREGRLFDTLNTMRRVGFQEWEEGTFDSSIKYDRPYPRANGLFLGYRWKR